MEVDTWPRIPPYVEIEAASKAEVVRVASLLGYAESEHGYVDADGATRHELDLVFGAVIADADPVSREAHLEFRWVPWDPLTGVELRPDALKRALPAATDD